MAKITDEMKDIASKAKGWAVATATKDGVPNVVAIGAASVLSENQILLMDNFMKKTEENIKANPIVAISVWDMRTQKGYQFKGKARIETSGKVFDEGVQMVKSMAPQLTSKAAVIVDVEEIYALHPDSMPGS